MPSKNAFFALLDGPVELGREEYVCYPVRVLASVMLEKDEGSNSSRAFDYETGLLVNFSYSTMFNGLLGL